MNETQRLEEASNAKRKPFPGIVRVVVEIFHETSRQDHIFKVADGVAFTEYPTRDGVIEATKTALDTAIGKYQTLRDIQTKKQDTPKQQDIPKQETDQPIPKIPNPDEIPVMYKRPRGRRGRPRKNNGQSIPDARTIVLGSGSTTKVI